MSNNFKLIKRIHGALHTFETSDIMHHVYVQLILNCLPSITLLMRYTSDVILQPKSCVFDMYIYICMNTCVYIYSENEEEKYQTLHARELVVFIILFTLFNIVYELF